MVVGKPASTSAAELAADRLLVELRQKDRRKFADLMTVLSAWSMLHCAPRSGSRYCRGHHLRSFSEALEYCRNLFGAWCSLWRLAAANRVPPTIVVDRTRQAAREQDLGDHEMH